MTTLTRARIAYQIRRDFRATNNRAGLLHDLLVVKTDPIVRADLLRHLAAHHRTLARLHRIAFPDNPCDRDGAAAHEATADLLRMLCDVEFAAAMGAGLNAPTTPLGMQVWMVLRAMAATPDLTARMRLLEQLYTTVYPTVGASAAETIACLPAPGMVGWRTLDEHPEGVGIAAYRAQRVPA